MRADGLGELRARDHHRRDHRAGSCGRPLSFEGAAGMIRPAVRAALFILLAVVIATAQSRPQTVIFYEDGFPGADSAAPSRETLAAALPQASFVDATALS